MQRKNTFWAERTLMCYLKPRQRKLLRPILHQLIRSSREDLSVALSDYLENGIVCPPKDVLLGGIYLYLTQRIHPLHQLIC